MTKQPKHFYTFGAFAVDPQQRVLLRDGQPIPLTLRAFDTLLVLVENAGRITEKDELLKRVWAGTFVEEATLAKNISTLRKALGDSAESEEYIQTVIKRGYRFVAAVERTASVESAAITPAPWRWLAAGGVAVAGLLMALLFFGPRDVPPVPATRASGKVRLAVLPFENLNANPEQEYFADGLTEEMINHLSRLYPEGLAVIARTSAMKYKDVKKDITQIGADLHADYILEGSVRREGNRVRITSQLVRVGDQTHLWGETYDRDGGEVLAVQNEVARTIAGRIGIELTGRTGAALSQRTSISPAAYEDYLKGRFFWNKMTVGGFRKAIQHFEAAISKDPAYAEAHAGLADSYASLGLWGLHGREALQRAKAAAEKAVTLRESLADGHASRAFIAMGYEWDWDTAEREFRRALELNPGHAAAHHRYGYYLMLRGRWDEAGAELRKAQELDPLSMLINANIGFRHYLMREYDAAIAHWKKNLEMEPDYPLLHGYLGTAYVMKKMYPEAIESFEKAKGTPGVTSALGYIYGVMGREEKARKQLGALLDAAKRSFVPAFYVALLYAGLGDRDQAFAWLDRAYEERSGYLMEIHLDPMFDPLRSDPRFDALLRRLGHKSIILPQ